MRLYGGCYERFLFGFEVAAASNDTLNLEQVLSIPAHQKAVKCMDSSGSLVVTGGADDQLHLFNMKTSTDLGFLVNPAEGAVPCVRFVRPPEAPQPSHLLSGDLNTYQMLLVCHALRLRGHMKRSHAELTRSTQILHTAQCALYTA
jgi:WD40 repeat protein